MIIARFSRRKDFNNENPRLAFVFQFFHLLAIVSVLSFMPVTLQAQENDSRQTSSEQSSQDSSSQDQSDSSQDHEGTPDSHEGKKSPAQSEQYVRPVDKFQQGGDKAVVGAHQIDTTAKIDWMMATFICIFSMLSATLFLWMRFAKYQFLGVIVNPYSITLIILVGVTCFGLFIFGSNTFLSSEIAKSTQGYASYLLAFGSAIISNFFPAIGRLLNLRKKVSTSKDSEMVKHSLNYFYTEILLHIQSKMRAELIVFARDFDWKLIKRLLSRIVTDCLAVGILTDEKAKELKKKISKYEEVDDEYDNLEAKYDAISTMLKNIHFKKVRAIFIEARE